jgi:hypothetical protein
VSGKLHRKMFVVSCLILAGVSGSVLPDYLHLWGVRGWTHEAAGVWVCIGFILVGFLIAFAGRLFKSRLLR